MDNLEKLYELNYQLDKSLEHIKMEQLKEKEKINLKKSELWNKMFDDLNSLKKYEYCFDTNIPSFEGKTWGFKASDNYYLFGEFSHKEEISEFDSYLLLLKRELPYQDERGTYDRRHWISYLERLLEDWDNVFENIKIELEKRIKLQMKQKIEEQIEEQKDINNKIKILKINN